MVDAPETIVRPYMFEPESDPEWEESAEVFHLENPAELFSMVTILCDIVTVLVFVCVWAMLSAVAGLFMSHVHKVTSSNLQTS